MTDKIAAPEGSLQGKPARASGGRLLAGLGVLFGLAGCAGAAYLLYMLVLLDPAAGIEVRLVELEADKTQIRAELRRLSGDQETTLEYFRNEQARGQRRAEELLAQKLEAFSAPEPVSEQAWKLAEAEYLLRVANQRVLMERDVGTALGLLKSADSILGELDDYAMHGVRATLADEILSLEQFATADISSIYLRLDAVKRQLNALTLAVPAFTLEEPAPATDAATASPGTATGGPGADSTNPVDSPGTPASAAGAGPDIESTGAGSTDNGASEAPGFLQSVALELGKLVRVRRIDTGFKPPLAPTEAKYLELNLRLMLEQAQLAVLKYDQVVYASSLDSALEWVHTHLDAQNTQVQETTSALQTLRTLNLASPTPDISASLNALIQARQADEGQAGQ